MKGETRRNEILKRLSAATTPVSAGTIAEEFGVSRQVIVQDIALLRANGAVITSLARGYIMEKTSKYRRVFKMHHSDEDAEKELNIIVDAGGTVEDVFIYHKVYGLVRAHMDIKSRHNVQHFIEDIESGKSSLLKNVTSGYHYHTITADSEETLDIIRENLEKNGFIAPLQEYEPSELQE